MKKGFSTQEADKFDFWSSELNFWTFVGSILLVLFLILFLSLYFTIGEGAPDNNDDGEPQPASNDATSTPPADATYTPPIDSGYVPPIDTGSGTTTDTGSSGTVDSGTVDTGVVDSGTVDTLITDTGSTNTGTTDSGTTGTTDSTGTTGTTASTVVLPATFASFPFNSNLSGTIGGTTYTLNSFANTGSTLAAIDTSVAAVRINPGSILTLSSTASGSGLPVELTTAAASFQAAYTASIWVRRDTWQFVQGQNGPFFSIGTMSTSMLLAAGLSVLSAGNVGATNFWWNNDFGAFSSSTYTDLNTYPTEFHLFTFVWDGTTRSIYMDGALLGSEVPTNKPKFFGSSPSFSFGSLAAPVNGFSGYLSDFRLYQSALTAEQIAYMYEAGPLA